MASSPSRRDFLRTSGLAASALALKRAEGALTAAPPALSSAAVASALRSLYAGPGPAVERWGRGSPLVRLPDGRQVEREQAYRDQPGFAEAARLLLGSPERDDAALGAWLLGSSRPPAREAAALALLEAVGHPQPQAAFEAARSLARVGGPNHAAPLAQRLAALPEGPVRSAAVWSLARLGSAPARQVSGLPAGFGRGVCWWYEGLEDDDGAASFAELRALGVNWISIHTWDPLQAAVDEPRWLRPRRLHAPRELGRVVAAARRQGLRVLFKPHLEMGHPPPSPEQRALLRGPESPARQALLTALRTERAKRGWHGAIEMGSAADWRVWFSEYTEYLLEYARRAQQAGCDALCVGRELDRTVLQRPSDWRQLIARTRKVFSGALTYSAHHATFAELDFWDALDAVGVAAYAPLCAQAAPSDAELQAGAVRSLDGLAAFARRHRREVWLTEAGYPALATAASRPWDEPRGPADPWLQARCWEALLGAVSTVGGVGGIFGWLWEGVSQPPFRDASFSLKEKPASFVLARWYAGLGARDRAGGGE